MIGRGTTVVIALCLATTAQAEEATMRKVIHDGTDMTLRVNGDDLSIAYLEPPAQLREIGVENGQVLVAGTWTRRDPRVLIGHAYAFAPGCVPLEYEIRGVVDQNGSLVVLG